MEVYLEFDQRIVYGSTLDLEGTPLANIVDGWSGPSTTADEIETSVLGDVFKTFQRGQIDPGEISFQISYDPADGQSTTLAQMFSECTVGAWTVNLAAVCEAGGGTVSESFNAWVKAFSVTASGKTNLVVADLTLRITGSPGLTGMTSGGCVCS